MYDNLLYHILWLAYDGAMTYRVRINPNPIVVDDDGAPVVGARVLEIVFPSDTVETIVGRVNVIVGAGRAKIMVGGRTLRSIPLC